MDKRKRGRPPGTGLDDTATLDRMADLMEVQSGLRPTTALRRVLPGCNDATVRRLQAKWREQSMTLRHSARQRRQSLRAAPPVDPPMVRMMLGLAPDRTVQAVQEVFRKHEVAADGAMTMQRLAETMAKYDLSQMTQTMQRTVEAMAKFDLMARSLTAAATAAKYDFSPTIQALERLYDNMRRLEDARFSQLQLLPRHGPLSLRR